MFGIVYLINYQQQFPQIFCLQMASFYIFKLIVLIFCSLPPNSWRAHTKPCAHQDPGERSSDPTGDWARRPCECPGVSGGGMGRQWPAMGSGELNVCLGISPFEESHHYRHYPYHSLVSGQTTGREHSPTHQQKIRVKIYWAWLSEEALQVAEKREAKGKGEKERYTHLNAEFQRIARRDKSLPQWSMKTNRRKQ